MADKTIRKMTVMINGKDRVVRFVNGWCEPDKKYTIKEARKKTGLTLEEVAAICGVGVTTVYRWEHNQLDPRFQSMRKLTDIYGVPFRQLIFASDTL